MISNKYNLIEKISEGSFGSVIKAENIRTKENVAIKFEIKNDSFFLVILYNPISVIRNFS